MNQPWNNGQSSISANEVEIERLLELVPIEDRGLLFQRVLANFHPQENTRRLEVGFVLEWSRLNNSKLGTRGPILQKLLAPEEDDININLVPKTKREWQVAQFAVATVIQWLPTTIGCHFLNAAFEKGGGEFNYKLPHIE